MELEATAQEQAQDVFNASAQVLSQGTVDSGKA
jgi:hypothetical protein